MLITTRWSGLLCLLCVLLPMSIGCVRQSVGSRWVDLSEGEGSYLSPSVYLHAAREVIVSKYNLANIEEFVTLGVTRQEGVSFMNTVHPDWVSVEFYRCKDPERLEQGVFPVGVEWVAVMLNSRGDVVLCEMTTNEISVANSQLWKEILNASSGQAIGDASTCGRRYKQQTTFGNK